MIFCQKNEESEAERRRDEKKKVCIGYVHKLKFHDETAHFCKKKKRELNGKKEFRVCWKLSKSSLMKNTRNEGKSIRLWTTHVLWERQLIFQIDIHEILLSCHFWISLFPMLNNISMLLQCRFRDTQNLSSFKFSCDFFPQCEGIRAAKKTSWRPEYSIIRGKEEGENVYISVSW